MRIGIYGRNMSDRHREGINAMFGEFQKVDVELYIFDEFVHHLENVLEVENLKALKFQTFNRANFIESESHVLLSIGGDGTLLAAATLVMGSGIPILGINTGRLGFLASLTLDHFSEGLKQIIDGKTDIDRRTVLKLEMEGNPFGEENFALNEMTVHRKDTQSMISIHAYVDGKYLNTYWADGLIISTPTGSTAYSLSCGGPITLPNSHNLIITPVSPHNLNVRPVLISDQSVITLKIEGRATHGLVSLDSRTATIPYDTVLTIMQNSFTINLMRIKNYSFLKTLRSKLHWGLDERN